MKPLTRFLLPVFALFILAAGVVGVAFARDAEDFESSRSLVNEHEFVGTVESIAPQAWVVDGLTLAVTARTEIKGAIQVGQMVKVHLFEAPNGTLTAREIELSRGVGDDNGNDISRDDDDDNGNDNTGDDNGNDNSWDDDDDDGNDNSGDDDDNNGNDNSGDDDDDDDDDNDSNDNSGDDDDDDDDDDDNDNDDDD